MSRPRMQPYCSLMISRKQFQQASNGVQPVSKTEPDLKLNDRQTNWEDYMLKVIVMLFLAYSIFGCTTHVAASNRGGTVTESVHVKF